MAVVAVSVEGPEELSKGRSKTGADFAFVGDPEGALLDTLALRHAGGHPLNKSDIARPASVLLRADGTIAWSSYADNYRVRPSAEQTLTAAREALGDG